MCFNFFFIYLSCDWPYTNIREDIFFEGARALHARLARLIITQLSTTHGRPGGKKRSLYHDTVGKNVIKQGSAWSAAWEQPIKIIVESDEQEPPLPEKQTSSPAIINTFVD